MDVRRTSAVAVVVLGALATVTACSGGSSSEDTPARVEPGTPTAAPTRSADGTLYPAETWQHADPATLGFDPKAMRRIAGRQGERDDLPARRAQGQGGGGVELAAGRRRRPAGGLVDDQVDHQ